MGEEQFSGSVFPWTYSTIADSDAAKVDHGEVIAEVHGLKRSSKWRTVERTYKEAHPACACCGKTYPGGRGIQIHHRFPFHDCILAGRADLELDERNLISLCEDEKGVETNDCHFVVGHCCSFRSFNPTVEEDAAGPWHGLTKTQIEQLDEFIEKVRNRPKSYPGMTADEQTAFRNMLDQRMPPLGS